MPHARLRPHGLIGPLLAVAVFGFALCTLVRAGDSNPGFTDIDARARELAAAPYRPPAFHTPEFLKTLSLERWRGLRYSSVSDDAWALEGGAFQPEFLVPGFVFDQTARLNVIDEDGRVRHLPFSPELVHTADKDLAENIRKGELGFAGFAVRVPDGASDRRLGVMSASHFQFAGKNARLGVFARPVALDTASAAGESFPAFREFWLRKPRDGDDAFTVLALMDSPAMTGAYEFTIVPGASTVVDVRAVLHRRSGATAPGKIGLAPLTGMFLFSETEPNPADYRPEVHNCDGLLVHADDEDWQWTPLKNPKRLAVGCRPISGLRGFGLIQRDNAFDHYQDLNARFDRAASVWVEPQGDWGVGRVELVEIPGEREYHANVMAYWLPDGEGDGSEPLSFAYRLYWMPPGLRMHDLGVVAATRMTRSPEGDAVTFYIDFEGDALNALPADTGLTSVVEIPKETTLLDKNLVKNEVTGGWRLKVSLALPKSGVLDSLLAARNGPPRLAVTACLKRGENLPEALTETWRYTLIP